MRYCIPLSRTFGDQDIDCARGEAMAVSGKPIAMLIWTLTCFRTALGAIYTYTRFHLHLNLPCFLLSPLDNVLV